MREFTCISTAIFLNLLLVWSVYSARVVLKPFDSEDEEIDPVVSESSHLTIDEEDSQTHYWDTINSILSYDSTTPVPDDAKLDDDKTTGVPESSDLDDLQTHTSQIDSDSTPSDKLKPTLSYESTTPVPDDAKLDDDKSTVVPESPDLIKPALHSQGSYSLYPVPSHLIGQSVHINDESSRPFIQLPTASVVQPMVVHPIQNPVHLQEPVISTLYNVPWKLIPTGVVYGSYPALGYDSYSSGYGLGLGSYGSGYGLGSGYSSSYEFLLYVYGSGYGPGSGYISSHEFLPYAYGSGYGPSSGYSSSHEFLPYAYGSGYRYGGLPSSSYGRVSQNNLIPLPYRDIGTFGRDAKLYAASMSSPMSNNIFAGQSFSASSPIYQQFHDYLRTYQLENHPLVL